MTDASTDPAFKTDLVVRRHGRPLGSARTLLFLHGLTDSGEGWPEAVSHWRDLYSIVTFDQRGHGESPRFTDGQLAGHPGDVMVDEALQLLAQLPSPPVVIGHSLGGAVALAAACRRPELVRGLVLEDPAPLGPDEPLHTPTRGEDYVAGVQPSITAPDEETLVRRRREAHPRWPESELLPTGRAEQQMDLRYLAHGEFKPSTPWTKLFAEVATPTLIVSGDQFEELCIGVDAERDLAAARNGNVQLMRLPGAGHCVRRDQPDAYYAAVDAWLDAAVPW